MRRLDAPPRTGGAAFAGLLGFVLVLYANPGNWFDGLQDIGFAKIAAGIALAALGGSWLLYGRRLRIGGWPGMLLVCLFALVGFSPLWSFWPRYSVDTFLDGLKYLAIFFVVANVIDSQERLRKFVVTLAIASLIPAFGCIVSWIRGEHLVDGDRVGWIGIFANPNDLAYHLAVGVAASLAAREGAKTHAARVLYLAFVVPMGVGVLLTQSRGGMLASGAVLTLWVLGSLKRPEGNRMTLPIRAFGLAIAILCAFAIAPGNPWTHRMESSQYHGEDMSARGRFDAWRTGMNIAAERPWTGVGAGAFMIAWPEFAPGDAGSARTVHNTFIQLIAELGVPAFIMFLLVLSAAFRGVARGAADPGIAPYARGVQCGLLGFAVCSLSGGLAFTWPLFLLLGAAFALPYAGGEGVPRGAAALPYAGGEGVPRGAAATARLADRG